MASQHASGPDAHRHTHDDPGLQLRVLDLDAEVLGEVTAGIVRSLPLVAPPRQVVDLGCGTGAGTFALLDRFPDAEVTAVDAAEEHLHRLQERAGERGVQARVRTVRADLDAGRWPDLGEPDLVWASASMHHMTDPGGVLARVHGLLRPGGLLAVVELAGFPRFLPADAPEDRPGLEERCHAVTDRRTAGHLPHRGADWGPALTAAGLAVVDSRTIAVDLAAADLPAPARDAVGEYALAGLGRLRPAVADALSPEDLAALDRLVDPAGPGSVRRRADLGVRTERQVWVARRER
ncbi:class I SAM-dependent methyltransferase [Blastococcus sp. SYSU D00695]